jgi:hypothetical protein
MRCPNRGKIAQTSNIAKQVTGYVAPTGGEVGREINCGTIQEEHI